jgi:arylsulfate sulfotransferase
MSRVGGIRPLLVGLLTISAFAPDLRAAMSASLSASVPSQAEVGTVINWTASVSGAEEGTLWYRFRARALGEGFKLIRDYGPYNTLRWTATEHEGWYEVEATVRNVDTGEIAQASVVYPFVTRIRGDTPVINETQNSLVFLYSAPECPEGSRMQVQFQAADNSLVTNTPYKDCLSGVSMNFYLAGLRAGTDYVVKHTIETGIEHVEGPPLWLTTPDVIPAIAGYTVLNAPQAPSTQGILLQSTFTQATVATDLAGNPVWFYTEPITYVTRPAPGGYFWAVIEAPGKDPSMQALRKFDLAGNTVQETNAACVNEQLAAMGKRLIGSFHHEASTLPDGKTLALASTEQILTDVQGAGDIDVISDMILVLNSDMEVVWAWDAFDYLDPGRVAPLGEKCSPTQTGCPPFYLSATANDWLHGNSVQLTPDGNLLYSARHQDWLLKIDYRNGQGNGRVLWKLGKDGDFTMNSNEPSPWFSHQHDAGFDAADSLFLALFDNGNTRNALDPTAHSRGQVLRVDEPNRTVTLQMNADLGVFSQALGSAKKLDNGNYHFNIGWLPDFSSISIELDPAGNVHYSVKIGTLEYRTFRMKDLYTP